MLKLRSQLHQDSKVLDMIGYVYRNPSASAAVLEEYSQYSVVLFFNEGCMRMYKDIGLDLKVLKVITEEELPPNLERAISGSYLPNH